MNDLYLQACPKHTREGLERVRYFPRMLVTVDDMETEHAYFREKLRRHNRYLHGWGVVCGLEVTAASKEGSPWCVHISEGYALGPYGDEIYVPAPGVDLDLANCGPGAATDPCEPDAFVSMGEPASGQTFYVAIKFAECLSHPVRAMPPGCGCEEELCEYSRIRDSFAFGCLRQLPYQPEALDPCDYFNGTRLPVCPPCPAEPWVVLAGVTLSASGENEMQNLNVDYSVRRQIFSTAVLQEVLERCCCKKQPKPEGVADVAVVNLTGTADLKDSSIKYSFDVTNIGGAVAKAVEVTSTIKVIGGVVLRANEFLPISADRGWTATALDGPFKAELGDMNSGDSVRLKFWVEMGQGTTSVTSEVEASTTTVEKNLENNRLTVTTKFDGTS